jgi:hypothetical protein
MRPCGAGLRIAGRLLGLPGLAGSCHGISTTRCPTSDRRAGARAAEPTSGVKPRLVWMKRQAHHPDARSTATAVGPVAEGSASQGLIIRLIIQTIRRDRSGPVQIDEASNVSGPDPSAADQTDVEHQATDLKVGGSNPSRRAKCAAQQHYSKRSSRRSRGRAPGRQGCPPPRTISPVAVARTMAATAGRPVRTTIGSSWLPSQAARRSGSPSKWSFEMPAGAAGWTTGAVPGRRTPAAHSMKKGNEGSAAAWSIPALRQRGPHRWEPLVRRCARSG